MILVWALGTPGVNANLTAPGNLAKRQHINKTENLETDFEVSKTIRTKTEQTPMLDQLSISVLINSDAMNQADGQPMPPKRKPDIENLIKQAIGFREGLDKFDLAFIPFAEKIEFDVPARGFHGNKSNAILKNISLGIAALVALLLGLKAIKNLQPVPISGGSASPVPGERTSQVSQLERVGQTKPGSVFENHFGLGQRLGCRNRMSGKNRKKRHDTSPRPSVMLIRRQYSS